MLLPLVDGASWPTEEHADEEEHQSLFAAYDWQSTDQHRLICQPCQTTGVKLQQNQHLEQGGEMMMMKNLNRRDSHGHHGSKRRELVQHAHTWITRIHSHTYINTVTTAESAMSTEKFNIAIYTFSDDEDFLVMKPELF